MKTIVRLTAFAAALLASGAASAAGTTSCTGGNVCDVNMEVNAEVIAACTSLQTTDIDFLSDRAVNVTSTANATITANCSTGTSYTIELDYSENTNGMTQRRVKNEPGTAFLDYKIFQPNAGGTAASTVEWGTEIRQTGSSFVRTGNDANQAYTAYGVLSRVTGSPVGTYSDIVNVKMSY